MPAALRAVIELSLGRFVSYALFGLAAGFLGKQVSSFVSSQYPAVLSYLLIALYLIYSAVITGKAEKGMCPAVSWSRWAGTPFIAGILTGISICPSFLGALTISFMDGGPIGGMLLFIGFFFGTTVYVIPMALAARLTTKKVFRLVGIVSSLAAAFYFLFLAADRAFNIKEQLMYRMEQAYIVDYTKEKSLIINASGDSSLTLKLKTLFPAAQIQELADTAVMQFVQTQPEHANIIILYKETIPDLTETAQTRKLNIVYALKGVQPDPAQALFDALNANYLMARKTRGFYFKLQNY